MDDGIFNHGLGAPEWVMLGIENPAGGVFLLASDRMTRAELQREAYSDNYLHPRLYSPPEMRPTIQLRAEMLGYTWVQAPTYQEAIRKLFTTWSPPERTRRALPPPDAELGDGLLTQPMLNSWSDE